MQSVLDLFEAPDYLEVGVSRGGTFLALKAAANVGVEPSFYSTKAETTTNFISTTTSDDYSSQIATRGTAFDVIYLNGLHTSEQTIRALIDAFIF